MQIDFAMITQKVRDVSSTQVMKITIHLFKSSSLTAGQQHRPIVQQIVTHRSQPLQWKGARRRPGVSCKARYDDDEELRNQKKALEALLRTHKEIDKETIEEEGPAAQPVIRDLPLWRIQSTALPGSQQVYHVHVPHYVSMFGELLDRPEPHRFGHLYLPGGSVNLANPDFELRPGTSAPLVGTLMEVVRHMWLEDGRLLILAVGLCRIKAVKQRQDIPHSRADMEVLPDLEEVEDRMRMAMQAVDACSGSTDPDMSTAMRAAQAAATAASSASILAWCNYETASLRKLGSTGPSRAQAPEEAPPGARKMFDKSKLVWRHILASLNGLKSGLKLGCTIGQGETAGLPHLQKEGGSAEREQAVRELAQVSMEAEAAAASAASTAASIALEQAGPGTDGLPASEQGPLNTVVQRGIPCKGPAKTPGERDEETAEGSLPPMPQACSDALQAERQVWRLHSEISELALLTHRLFSAPEVLLPEGVMQLDPRSSDSSSSSSSSSSSVTKSQGSDASSAAPESLAASGEDGCSRDASVSAALPEQGDSLKAPVSAASHVSTAEADRHAYPALLRAKRLSFCMAAALHGKFDGAEGAQAVLEASSIAARLNLIMEVLQERRDQLSTLHALEKGYGSGGQQDES